MLKEIEIFEGKNSRMEDEIISILDELERIETEQRTKEEELEVRRLHYEQEKKMIEEEMNSLAGELDGCVRESEELKKEIPAELIRKYEQIKGARQGVAVVAVLEMPTSALGPNACWTNAVATASV